MNKFNIETTSGREAALAWFSRTSQDKDNTIPGTLEITALHSVALAQQVCSRFQGKLTSGYRSPGVNAGLNDSAPASAHLTAEAFDVYMEDPRPLLRAALSDSLFGGEFRNQPWTACILERDHVHINVRPGSKKVATRLPKKVGSVDGPFDWREFKGVGAADAMFDMLQGHVGPWSHRVQPGTRLTPRQSGREEAMATADAPNEEKVVNAPVIFVSSDLASVGNARKQGAYESVTYTRSTISLQCLLAGLLAKHGGNFVVHTDSRSVNKIRMMVPKSVIVRATDS